MSHKQRTYSCARRLILTFTVKLFLLLISTSLSVIHKTVVN